MAKKKTVPVQFKMGWLPDIPDARDFSYSAPLKVMLKLPPKIDISAGFPAPKIYNQGSLGSCTANALSAAFQFGQKKQKKTTFMPSRLFLYYNERVIINTVNSDSGAFIRDGIKSLNKKGICKESLWPYNESKFTQKPPQACYTEALKNQITSYQRITNNLNTMKGCLAEGYPFVFGFTVYESFMTPQVAKSGVMPMPKANEEVVGGHAVTAAGFDDKKQAFWVRNSWGTGWGKSGYFWMPYAYISNSNLADD
ncbi:MAG: C1 family peptidase, partial [Bacteroidota bacterium]